MILDVLLQASTECSSIEAACADLEEVADSNTIGEYLNQAIDVKTLRERETQINAALASCISQTMVRVGIEIAIDFRDEPFCEKESKAGR